jgi:hypothetical protein
MNGPLTIQTTLDLPYSDSRTHAPPGATRNVRLPRATPSGGTMSRSEDGQRCAVAGTDCKTTPFRSLTTN